MGWKWNHAREIGGYTQYTTALMVSSNNDHDDDTRARRHHDLQNTTLYEVWIPPKPLIDKPIVDKHKKAITLMKDTTQELVGKNKRNQRDEGKNCQKSFQAPKAKSSLTSAV
jgi:hypothetical protein